MMTVDAELEIYTMRAARIVRGEPRPLSLAEMRKIVDAPRIEVQPVAEPAVDDLVEDDDPPSPWPDDEAFVNAMVKYADGRKVPSVVTIPLSDFMRLLTLACQAVQGDE